MEEVEEETKSIPIATSAASTSAISVSSTAKSDVKPKVVVRNAPLKLNTGWDELEVDFDL